MKTIRLDHRPPEDKAKSISYLYAFRRLMLDIPPHNASITYVGYLPYHYNLKALAELNFSSDVIVMSLKVDMPILLNKLPDGELSEVSDAIEVSNFVYGMHQYLRAENEHNKEPLRLFLADRVINAHTSKELLLCMYALIGARGDEDAFNRISEPKFTSEKNAMRGHSSTIAIRVKRRGIELSV